MSVAGHVCFLCGAPADDECPLCGKFVCRLCAEGENGCCCDYGTPDASIPVDENWTPEYARMFLSEVAQDSIAATQVRIRKKLST